MKTDKNSPPAGEAGEHGKLRVYVDGNWDVGTVTLKGWTLVANDDLAVMKKQIADQEEKLKLLVRSQATLSRLVRGLDELGFDNDDEPVGGADTVEFICQVYDQLKEVTK